METFWFVFILVLSAVLLAAAFQFADILAERKRIQALPDEGWEDHD